MGWYFEDFEEGQVFVTPARTVTEADVVTFAGLSGDYNPLHTDAEFAARTPFGTRIAHGLLVLSIVSGLGARTGLFDETTIALLGVDWRFLQPVRMADTIRAEMTVSRKRTTRHPERGILVRGIRVLNQRNEVVQEGTMTLMIRRRPVTAQQCV
ncbi:MAG: dehydratase [Armatimonadetes bacterium]|nr:dehydratase [Armatimonadota bacterium]